MTKYESLVNILDRLRFDAPPEFKNYRPSGANEEALNQARSRSLGAVDVSLHRQP